MAGKGLRGGSHRSTWTRTERICDTVLPFESYFEKLLLAGQYIGLRSEPTVTINLQALPAEARSGRFVFERVIMAGCELYTDRDAWDELTNMVHVFKPLTFPHIINWATKPVSSALKALWTGYQERLDDLPTPWDEIELVCLLERLLAYGQTGNLQVINGALANAFGIKHSIETVGFPCFSSALDTSNTVPKIREGYWPTRATEGNAITVANATLKYYYSEAVAQARASVLTRVNFQTHNAKATLSLLYSSLPPPDEGSSLERHDLRMAKFLGEHLLSILLNDMKAYVLEQCTSEIDHLARAPGVEERNHVATRRQNLYLWNTLSHPWGQGDAHRHLMLALVSAPRQEAVALTASEPSKITARALADMIVTCMDTERSPNTSPLFVKSGAFRSIAPAIRDMAFVEVDNSPKTLDRLMADVVTEAIRQKHVCRLPWSPKKVDGGRQTSHISIKYWITIDSSTSNLVLNRSMGAALRLEAAAAQIAMEAEILDQNAHWSAFSGPLSEQRRHLRRRSPPDDLQFRRVIETVKNDAMQRYLEGIAARFDLNDPVHRFAVRVGSIVSHLLPRVNLAVDDNFKKPEEMTADDVIVKMMEWQLTTRANVKGGLTNRPVWASLFVLAWLFYQYTPIGHSMLKGEPYSEWLKKLGAKLINSRLFIRLGMARSIGSSERILSKGDRFGTGWVCIVREDVLKLLHFIEGNLEEGNIKVVVEVVLGGSAWPLVRDSVE
ncbi:hypothetical protein FRB90_002410 [Tulasnella sp. 427]|nr:hypothetical protein FRB90_002410 [Tulasnella sp. 427]